MLAVLIAREKRKALLREGIGLAIAMLESGASVKALANCLGHSSPVMTLNVYSHLIAESIEPVLLKADALMTGANGKLVRIK